MQSERRTNPYPWTWEIPALVGLLVLLVMILAIHAGRFLAVLFSGGAAVLPTREALIVSAFHVVGGEAGAGLAHPLQVAVSNTTLWALIALCEVAALVGCAAAIRWAWGRWGQGRLLGMASASQAQQTLGLHRLRKVAPVVRPDLYGKAAR